MYTIASAYYSDDDEGETVFPPEMLSLPRVVQLDLVKDLISDLSHMYEWMVDNKSCDMTDYLEKLNETGNKANFKLQRGL